MINIVFLFNDYRKVEVEIDSSKTNPFDVVKENLGSDASLCWAKLGVSQYKSKDGVATVIHPKFMVYGE